MDTLGGYDWQVTNSMIRGLTSFWAGYARRWVRLRAKLFVRSDLYRRSTETVGADIAKLAANRAELSWSDKNMYAMLVKRIANSHPQLFDLCRKARIDFTRTMRARPRSDHFKRQKMPANWLSRCARSTWAPIATRASLSAGYLDHVRDGRKKAHPRSFVRLFERAAEQEMNQPRAESHQLLHPISLRRPLDVVSRDHVGQAADQRMALAVGREERLTWRGNAAASTPNRKRPPQGLVAKLGTE